MRGRGGGALKARHYIFVGGGRAVFFFLLLLFCFVLFFQPSGRLAFMQVVILLKNAVLCVSFVQMGSSGMKNKINIFGRGFSRQNGLWHNVSATMLGLIGNLTL